MKKTKTDHYTDKEALEFHSHKRPGKIEIVSSKRDTVKILKIFNGKLEMLSLIDK